MNLRLSPDRNRIRNTLLLASAICVAAMATYVATLRRVGDVPGSCAWLACGLVLVAYLPPLWFSYWISQGAVRQLLVCAWRFGILLPVLGAMSRLSGDERNCFLSVLLACYFVALPLESWLLIREAKKKDGQLKAIGSR